MELKNRLLSIADDVTVPHVIDHLFPKTEIATTRGKKEGGRTAQEQQEGHRQSDREIER